MGEVFYIFSKIFFKTKGDKGSYRVTSKLDIYEDLTGLMGLSVFNYFREGLRLNTGNVGT